MRVDINKINEKPHNKYMNIPFAELVGIVFAPNGDLNDCPRNAIRALIRRLECRYPGGGFGHIKTGNINEMNAYIASVLIIRRGQIS